MWLKPLFPWKHNKTKMMAAVEQTMDNEHVAVELNLLPCHVCGRTFLPATLKKHERICEKSSIKKRRVFDSLKQRVEGTDLAVFHQPTYLKRASVEDIQIKPNKWKEKHQELMNTIRAAKSGDSVIRKTPTLTQNYERCPSCDRHFGPKAFDRHVEWCKERKARIQHSPANVLAKERLEARIKYKVPPLNKSKRALTREKYSPTAENVQRTPVFQRSVSLRKPKSDETRKKSRENERIKSMKNTLNVRKIQTPEGNKCEKTTKVEDSSHNNGIVCSKEVLTCSNEPENDENSYLVDLDAIFNDENCLIHKTPAKSLQNLAEECSSLENLTKKVESNSIGSDPFKTAEHQFMELLECDDFKLLSNDSKQKQKSSLKCSPKSLRPKTTTNSTPKKPTPLINNKKSLKSATNTQPTNKRSSIIDPPFNFKDSTESINDDFELLENMINNSLNNDLNEDILVNLDKTVEDSNKKSLNLDKLLNNNRKYSDDMSSIDPRLINETDNLSIPEHFQIDDLSPTSTIDTDITIRNVDIESFSNQYVQMSKNDLHVLEQPVMKRSISLNGKNSIEKQSKLPSKKQTTKTKYKTTNNLSNCSKTDEKKKNLATLKRSLTLFTPKPTLKTRDEIDNYFTEHDKGKGDRNSPEKENFSVESSLKPEDLFAVDDEMYEEYKKYEEMYLKEKEQKIRTKKMRPKPCELNFGLLMVSDEDETAGSPQINKISDDSAYGSLNRNTPKHRNKTSKLTTLEQKNIDSTSSSGSENNLATKSANQQRFSKFCHECGNKYPVTTAKFCVECGVKRLAL